MLHACADSSSSSVSGLKTSLVGPQGEPQPGEVGEQQHDRHRERHLLDRRTGSSSPRRRAAAARRRGPAGTSRAARARPSASSSIVACAPAASATNLLRSRPQPPTRNAAPITSSRFPRIEPMIEAFTTSCRPSLEREQRDDQLRRVAERDVQQAADARPGAVRELLGRPAHQRRGRHDAERGREEDDDRVRAELVEHDRDRDEGDEQVRPALPAEQELAQLVLEALASLTAAEHTDRGG